MVHAVPNGSTCIRGNIKERQDIKVVKINVDEEPELASRFQIMSIPTLFVIKDGKIKIIQ